MPKQIIALITIIILFTVYNQFGSEKEYGPGVSLKTIPFQKKVSMDPFLFKDYQVTPKAQYIIEAKILRKERYYRDASSELSPVDFALGWNRMSDERNLEQLSISQGSRWYTYRWNTELIGISKSIIAKESANTHIIPANDKIEDIALDIKAGTMVHMEGYLVYIQGRNNFKWNSSLTRNDTGGGACEVFFVTGIREIVPTSEQLQ